MGHILLPECQVGASKNYSMLAAYTAYLFRGNDFSHLSSILKL